MRLAADRAQPPGAPWDAASTSSATPTGSGAPAADDSPEELYALWRDAVGAVPGRVAEALADGGLDRPVEARPPTPASRRTLRRMLVDLHDEYARHVGHADLLREADRRPGRRGPAAAVMTDDAQRAPIPAEQLTVVPANRGVLGRPRRDLRHRRLPVPLPVPAVQGRRLDLARLHPGASGSTCTGPDRAAAKPERRATSGLVAYVDGEPAGWVAVEPRTAYPKLRTLPGPVDAAGDEDKDDDGVWAVTCFVVRKGYRGRGLTYPLARATVDYARERGPRRVEGYPMITQPGKEITWGELHVGAAQVFEDAGFTEVTRPTRPSGGDADRFRKPLDRASRVAEIA